MGFVRKASGVLVTLLTLVGGMTLVASARPIIHPLQGSTVRGKVQIEVSRKVLGENGYAVIKLNDTFCVATAGSNPSKNLIYIWDSKTPLPGESDSDLPPADGPYRIAVEAHNSAGRIVATDQVRVFLANKVHPKGSGRVNLSYAYSQNGEPKYHEHTVARVTDLGYFASQYHSGEVRITEGDAFYRILVDDLRPDGSAFVRFRISPDVTLSDATGMLVFPKSDDTVYGSITKKGSFARSNRSRGKNETYTNCIPVAFPNRAVGVGDSWSSHFVNPAFVDKSDVDTIDEMAPIAHHTLIGFEWENGHPCAKIRTTYTRKGKDPQGLNYIMKVTQISYFAYNMGKMLRTTCNTEITLTGDQTLVGNILSSFAAASSQPSGTSAGTTGIGMAGAMPGMVGGGVGMAGMPGGMASPGMMPGMPGGAIGGMPGMPGVSTRSTRTSSTLTTGTEVPSVTRVKLVIDTESSLIRKF